MATETEIQLVRIAEAMEQNGKTLEAIEQLLVNEDGHASTLVRIESLLDLLVSSTEKIDDATAETAYYSHGLLWRLYGAWSLWRHPPITKEMVNEIRGFPDHE